MRVTASEKEGAGEPGAPLEVSNPFVERGRIVDAPRFVGRWRELSLLFDRIEEGRPVLITGAPGVGISSFLTHVTQSAALNLEDPTLRAFYLDLAGAESAAQVYRTLVEGLGQRGDTLAALELALVEAGAPVLLCLDNTDAGSEAGWGAPLLDALARIARRGDVALVAAARGDMLGELSERFARISLGAFAAPEVRLLAEAYLEGGPFSFTPAELRELADLSASHPAYLQRAAFHLFHARLDPTLDWRAAYLDEARERPVPGAPLPPGVFEGAAAAVESSRYSFDEGEPEGSAPPPFTPPALDGRLLYALPILAALLALALGGGPAVALAVAALGGASVFLALRRP